MVVVGLDRALAARELQRLAPSPGSEEAALVRARLLRLEPAGAARRIAAILAGAT